AVVHPGSATWPTAAPTYKLASPLGPGLLFSANRIRSGDVDGDAVCDLVIGAGASESTVVYLGGIGGVAEGSSSTIPRVARLTSTSHHMSLGDLDGDRLDDVLFGLPETLEYPTNALYVYVASSSGFPSTPTSVWLNLSGSSTDLVGSETVTGRFLDGDAVGVVASAPGARMGGKLLVFGGGPLPLSSPIALPNPDGTGMNFGLSLEMPGDLNGDGHDDLVVPLPSTSSSGTVFVYLGPLSSATVPIRVTWSSAFAPAAGLQRGTSKVVVAA